MNVYYGSIYIKNIGEFIVPGTTLEERKTHCSNLLNGVIGVFVPKLDQKYNKIIAIGTIADYRILTIDDICDDKFNYHIIDGHILDMLKLELYFDDQRYKPRLTILSEMLHIKNIISTMSDDEYKVLFHALDEFISTVLDLDELEEIKYEDDFNEEIYDKQVILLTNNFDTKFKDLMDVAPYLRLYGHGSQLYSQYCLLSEFISMQKQWLGVLIHSTYWLNLAMRLCGIREEFDLIRQGVKTC